ncbi:MAG TPA: sulfurtransferase TusA family protein [Symbiobacteriaceae bacterium]|nr:sulfurtransferase TusA family protein [Symbiobacteriaceae bacterium]
MSTTTSTATVDARGLACPMPIVRARKAIDTIAVGEVLEVLATDKGAPADFRSWCLQTDQKFLGLAQEDGFFRMYIKKVVGETKEKGRVYPHEISNEQLAELLSTGTAPLILDVREEHEYQAGHIPGAVHVPIEQIEEGTAGLDRDREIAVVCRSARRSDYACQIMSRNGFARAVNVVPGMSEWKGSVIK